MKMERGCCCTRLLSLQLRTLLRFLLLLLSPSLLVTSAFNLDEQEPLLLFPSDQVDVHFGYALAHFFDGTERR